MQHYLKNVLKSVLVFPQLKKKVRERENFLENLNPDQFFTFLLNWWFKLRKFIVTPGRLLLSMFANSKSVKHSWG